MNPLRRILSPVDFGLITHLVHQLHEESALPLPGIRAHLAVSANQVAAHWELEPNHQKSAVLILLYPRKSQWHIVLMLRARGDKTHSGEVSFPGGRMEEKDLHPTFTALREADEELAIKADQIEVLGHLSQLYIPVSNFLVYPILAYTNKRPAFEARESEVAEIMEVRMKDLLRPEALRSIPMRLGSGLKIQVPSFEVGPYPIWGATAMILNELLELIRRR
ncbi:MAG: CoA pyrophosphatase [Bacteroidota bacterium]